MVSWSRKEVILIHTWHVQMYRTQPQNWSWACVNNEVHTSYSDRLLCTTMTWHQILLPLSVFTLLLSRVDSKAGPEVKSRRDTSLYYLHNYTNIAFLSLLRPEQIFSDLWILNTQYTLTAHLFTGWINLLWELNWHSLSLCSGSFQVFNNSTNHKE